MDAQSLPMESAPFGAAWQRVLHLALTLCLIGCDSPSNGSVPQASQPPAAAGANGAEAPSESTECAFRGPTMGTAYSVKCWTREPAQLTLEQLQSRVDELLAEINRQMSTYDPQSELSQFNRAGADEWFAVSPATAGVVAAAIELHERTEGALDVTIVPVLRMWHFGAGADQGPGEAHAPDAAALDEALQATGVAHLQARLDPPALRKDAAGLEVDLSAIAKGYGVDAVSDLLAECGYRNSMVEIGGEVRCRGQRFDGGPWRIGVESPATRERAITEAVPLSDMAMATSGDYRNYRRADGKLVTHIVDPRTGQALPFRGMSVSVLAPTCMEADALATALVVLGDERAYDWCEEHHVAALFQQRDAGGQLERRATTAFQTATKADVPTDSTEN